MFETAASREFDVEARTVWELLSDWGNTRWLPGPPKTDVFGSGDRVVRRLHVPGSEPIEETMLDCDPGTMRIHYTIAVSERFPLKDYSGTIMVQPADNGCRVDWQCRFDQGDMGDEQAGAIADRNLNVLLDSLASYLETR